MNPEHFIENTIIEKRSKWLSRKTGAGFPGVTSGKEPACQFGDMDSIPGSRCPGVNHGSSLQHCCLENPKDRGAWQATVHRLAQSWT